MIIWVGIVSFLNEYADRHMFSGQILVLKIRVVRSGSVDIRQERWLARQAVFPFSFTNTTLSADVPMSAQRYIFPPPDLMFFQPFTQLAITFC